MYINGGKTAQAVFPPSCVKGIRRAHDRAPLQGFTGAIILLGCAPTGTRCAWVSAGDKLASALDIDGAGSRFFDLATHQVKHLAIEIYRSDDI